MLTIRRAFVVLVFLAALLPACMKSSMDLDWGQTPAGHRLAWENVGAVPGWFSLIEIGTHLDDAVEDAVQYLHRYGADGDLVRTIAQAHRNVGYDAARFAINASQTGFATGAYHAPSRTIQLAFWTRVKGDVVPADAPKWTVYSWPTRPSPKYDWGVLPRSFPANRHELGHAWAMAIYGQQLGSAFEHTWTPPILNPPSAARLAAEAAEDIDWNRDCVVEQGG